MSLTALIHRHLYSVLLEIVVGYKKLRSFQGPHVNSSVLLEELDIPYPSLYSQNRISRTKLQNYSEDLGPC